MNQNQKAIIIFIGLLFLALNHWLYLQEVYNNWTALIILIILTIVVYSLTRKKKIQN